MNDEAAHKRNKGLIALMLWLGAVVSEYILYFQWVESPWILQSDQYGIYWMIGGFIVTIVGLAILGHTNVGKPGAVWNTALGLLHLFTGVALVWTLLFMAPEIGYIFSHSEYRAVWWIILAIFYAISGYNTMPSKTIPTM